MKRAIIASVCAASVLVSVACTSNVSGSGGEAESTASSHEAISGTGCSTIGLSRTGSATTDEGVSYSNDSFTNCEDTPGLSFTTTGSYTGTAACSDAAILELKNPTGLPNLQLVIDSPPTQESDCVATLAQVQVWGMKVVNGQDQWTYIENLESYGTWQGTSGPCVYNGGAAEFLAIASATWENGYTTFRFVASASETTGLKGTPTTKLYPMTLLAFGSCVY